MAAGAGLVAAAAVVIALVLGLQVHHLHGQVNALQATPNLSAAERAAIGAPGTTRVPLCDPGAAGHGSTPATIVLTAAGTGFVINDAERRIWRRCPPTALTSCGAWSGRR